MLLDESTADDTFNKTEQAKVEDFIQNDKGVFIVSGSEVGWDLVEKGDAADKSFYETYFRAKYISDAPGTGYEKYTAEDNNHIIYHFDDGTHVITKIGYPDLIQPLNGSEESFTYPGIAQSKGVAGVSYKTATGGMEYLAFPIEAIYRANERKELLSYLLQKYSHLLLVKDNFIQTQVHLYPNPTIGLLTIDPPASVKIRKIKVFNIFGQQLIETGNNNRIDLSSYPKGMYIIRILDEAGRQGSFKVLKQ